MSAEITYRGGTDGGSRVLDTRSGVPGDLIGLNSQKEPALISPTWAKLKVFSFAFDTEGLDTGVVVCTPSVGEVLLDAWVSVVEAFDGTTPLADIGTFVGTNDGLFAAAANPVALGTADAAYGGTGFLGGDGATTVSLAGQAAVAATDRVVPGRFSAENPLQLVVSQTGAKGGTAIGGAAGSGRLYIVTAVPEAI